MSGGNWDYAFRVVEDLARRLEDENDVRRLEAGPPDPLRLAFADHLRLVARAMHDIEWVDSGDKATGDEAAAIRACLALAPPSSVRLKLSGGVIARDYYELRLGDSLNLLLRDPEDDHKVVHKFEVMVIAIGEAVWMPPTKEGKQ